MKVSFSTLEQDGQDIIFVDFLRNSGKDLNLPALISLIIVLAKMHYAIGVLEEKIKVAFDLINKHNDSHR